MRRLEPPGQRAIVRLEELVRRFDLLGVPTQQGGDAALRRTVAQQQELRPLDGPLAVADMAGVDLPDVLHLPV